MYPHGITDYCNVLITVLPPTFSDATYFIYIQKVTNSWICLNTNKLSLHFMQTIIVSVKDMQLKLLSSHYYNESSTESCEF